MQEKEFAKHLQESNFWSGWWSAPSVYAGIALLLTRLLDWNGGEPLSPFIFALVEMVVYFVFIAVSIGAFVKAITTKLEKGIVRFKFVGFDSLVVLMAIFFPFEQFMKVCDFNLNFARRMEIVKMIKEGKITESAIDGRTAYALPERCRDLSHGGGEVMVIDVYRSHDNIEERNFHVLFFIQRGLLRHYSGFEYCLNGKPGNITDKPKRIEPLRQNWYWVVY